MGSAQKLGHVGPNEWALCKLHANQQVHSSDLLAGETLVGVPGLGARSGPPEGETKSHQLPLPTLDLLGAKEGPGERTEVS